MILLSSLMIFEKTKVIVCRYLIRILVLSLTYCSNEHKFNKLVVINLVILKITLRQLISTHSFLVVCNYWTTILQFNFTKSLKPRNKHIHYHSEVLSWSIPVTINWKSKLPYIFFILSYSKRTFPNQSLRFSQSSSLHWNATLISSHSFLSHQQRVYTHRIKLDPPFGLGMQ